MSQSPFADQIPISLNGGGGFPLINPMASEFHNGQRQIGTNGGHTQARLSNGSINGQAPVPVPGQQSRPGNGANVNNDPMRGPVMPANGHRSPPNQKSFSHVPCKFYKSGQCQAGKTCPFSHESSITPCKYFQKGNCKFGLRCANDHITTDGRRINKPAHLQMNPQFNMNMGPRVVSPQMPISGAALMAGMPTGPDQFMHQQAPIPGPFSGQIPDELLGQPWPHGPQDIPAIPTIDTTASSMPGSLVGSPQNETMLGRSPAVKGLTVLEAPLPASFDSQGISIYAKYGPIAASMPARFENSPPSNSILNTRPVESSALRNLRTSAYDEARGIGLGSSPTVNPDESISRRIMHSERFSSARPRMLSSSVGTRRSLLDINKDDDWDQNLMFEEDLVPNSLNDLLTPQERARRSSRTQEDSAGDLFAHRSALSGLGSEAASPKVGSPLGGTSPGRFGPLFTRQQKERSGSDAAVGGGLAPGSFPGETSGGAFGPVGMGSPLRPSPLNPSGSLSPSMRPVSGSGIGAIGNVGTSSRPTSGDFSVSSPQRKATIGIISQQLQRARLSSRASDTSIDGNVAAASAGNGPSGVTASPAITVPPRLAVGDRTVSVASSVGLGARERIDEEPSGVFSMDQDDDEEGDTQHDTVSAVPAETVRSAKSSQQPVGPTPFGTSKWSKVVAGGASAAKSSATTASIGVNGNPRENGKVGGQ